MMKPLDAKRHGTLRGGPSFSLRFRLERLAFAIVWRTLSWILPPPVGWGWRRMILRMFGAKIGDGAKIYPSVSIWLPRLLTMGNWSTLGPAAECYNMAMITIGEGTTVSQRAFLCAGDHDHHSADFQLQTSPLTLGPRCWIAAEAFVGPGVTIGEGAVLAARGVATKDIPEWTVWGGNPARQISVRERDAF